MDRMELIRLSGYPEDEKMHTPRCTEPKQDEGERHQGRRDVGHRTGRAATSRLLKREAGVRGLDREIATDLRKVVKSFTKKKDGAPHHRQLEEPRQVPGRAQVHLRHREKENQDRSRQRPRVTKSAASSSPFEAGKLPGKGQHGNTVQAGEVRQESIHPKKKKKKKKKKKTPKGRGHVRRERAKRLGVNGTS